MRYESEYKLVATSRASSRLEHLNLSPLPSTKGENMTSEGIEVAQDELPEASMNALKYGPQSAEIEVIVAKFADRENNAVWSATFAETWDADAVAAAAGPVEAAASRARIEARDAGRTTDAGRVAVMNVARAELAARIAAMNAGVEADRGAAMNAAADAASKADRAAGREAPMGADWKAGRKASRKATRAEGREADWEADWNAAWKVDWNAARNAAWGLGAIAVGDLIGEAFTQGHYDLLTKSLMDFLAIVDETGPLLQERDLAIYFLQTMNGADAVAEAKRMLG